jgi:hypothetical protein
VTPTVQDKPASPGRLRTWLARAAVVALLAAAGLAVTGVYARYRNTARLKEAVAGLDSSDPNWRIEAIESGRAAVPDAENSAPRVLAAASWLPPAWPPKEHRAIFRLVPGAPVPAGQLAALRNEMAECQTAVSEALPLADLPRGRYPITYARLIVDSAEVPQHREAHQLCTLLYFDALLHALDRDPAAALRSCRATLNTARSIGDEPLMVPQMVRTIGVLLACLAAEQTLARSEPSPQDLASLQKLFEDEDGFPRLAVALRGERACMHRRFEYLEKDPELAAASAPEEAGQLSELLWGPPRQSEHPRMLELFGRRLEAAERLPLHERAADDRAVEFRLAALSPDEVAFTRKAFLSLDRVDGAFIMAHARVRCLIACLAADRYRQEHGQWPAALTDLVPSLLGSVLADPYDGQPLRYGRLADGVRVYSVGPDGIDDGGRIGNNDSFRPRMDLGIRLRDADRRGPKRAGD